MNTLQQTTTMAKLPNIDDVIPISDEDRECLREMKDVLIKHGRLDRFGVSLLHEHFPVAEDEILVEECDIENRTLTTRPMKRSDVEGTKMIETNWRLDTVIPSILCQRICRPVAGGYHAMRHRSYEF